MTKQTPPSPLDNELKCVELIQTQLMQVRDLLMKGNHSSEILEQIASIRFTIRSMESTLVEKNIQSQVEQVLEISNRTHQLRERQKIEA